ncbi:MAG: hypothetical protein U5O16_40810 [Rhodococcus sp. (in: high G+C Gram-positive bacteria)]|uniref:hypothetical protein n=1 Tax=Rhodococcus sp. TaxID=1831 RepID=UPI002AD8BE4A|nr:hypothetical protein [Rhodococcus sp. (in: high G+C Gram-positive bacteria)]
MQTLDFPPDERRGLAVSGYLRGDPQSNFEDIGGGDKSAECCARADVFDAYVLGGDTVHLPQSLLHNLSGQFGAVQCPVTGVGDLPFTEVAASEIRGSPGSSRRVLPVAPDTAT